ncbi:MAG TPA: HAMP domain-containing sensor histidine kinase [Gemmatimonadota bacterium]|nr:HAMP domain-containing sensor histidine kinase [Gemmatimonadota bacterium]
MSVRGRVLIGTLCLVAAAMLIADFAVYRFLGSFLYGRVDDQLESGMWAAPRVLGLTTEASTDGAAVFERGRPATIFPPGTYFAYLSEEGALQRDYVTSFGQDVAAPLRRPQIAPPRIPADLPGSAGGGGPSFTRFTVEAVEGPARYRVLVDALTGGGTVLVAIPLTNPASTLHRLVLIEAGVTVGVLVAVGLLGFFVIRRGLRPLDRIADSAGAIAAGDLSTRVAPADDRTEVGRLGAALNTMLSQIETAFEERQASQDRLRRFVADASHELRTPLTSIQGYAELFRRGASERPEDLAKAMRQIETESRRMAELVDELLLLARLDQPDSVESPIELATLDLATIVAEAVEAARDLDQERRIALAAKGGPVIVLGDELRLRQLLDNLLSNVREHTPSGTRVRALVGREDGLAVVEVSDDGPGIDEEDAARVFERFFRVDPSRSRQRGGVGLGFSIVSAIAEAHGGRATCEPVIPHGVRFRIELPLAEESARETEPATGGAGTPVSPLR